jgi:hypothetical protein
VPCEPVLGDPAETDVVPETRDAEGRAVEIGAGDVIDLIRPSQGGHVVFVGARATGICADGPTLTGRLLFPDEVFINLEGRPLDLKAIDELPGWGRPDYSTIAGLANIPVCPNNTGRPLLGVPLRVEAEVEDRDGRIARARVEVSLACRQADLDCRALCECECDEGYDIAVGCDLPEGIACELP